MAKQNCRFVLPDAYNSLVEEKKILKFWSREKIFQKLQDARRENNDGKLSYHSGPIFPTGAPHAGHILNSIVKDVLSRYGHARNLQVESRFGWDSHGLPVEYEVDKRLGLKSSTEIQEMGTGAYNAECRAFAQQHHEEWKNTFERMGNWVDFTREYNTLSVDYMEQVWRVFKRLYDKGLVYKDTKVLPYSTACRTNVSNFEAVQNIKEVTEVGYTMVVKIVNSKEKLLIWTSRPWDLVINCAVCVNPRENYVRIKINADVYILSKNQVNIVFKNPHKYILLDEFLGETLQHLEFVSFFNCNPVNSSCQVLLDESLSEDIGTGIVSLNEEFTESPKQRGCVYNVKEVTYKKPYCWRSDTPLINKEVSSWFIRVEAIVKELIENASQVNWFPDNSTEFSNWLRNHSTDWSVSRTRCWGTPVPIWSSESGDETVCVGSIEELKQLTGKTVITDLHRECVDWLVIPSKTKGNPPLRRVPEVLDCWFESGAMPFAVNSQPFQADFVAEGVDQIRGWFYTSLVLSTALSQLPPFRNIFTIGLVQEPNGFKVSKRKHNQSDYLRLVEKYGADCLRLYFINTPAINSCQNFTMQEEGVASIGNTVIQPLYRIFSKCINNYNGALWLNAGYLPMTDVIDQWILSCTESLVKFYDNEIKSYRLHTIGPKLIELLSFIEDWYMPIRLPDIKMPEARNARSMRPQIQFNVINIVNRLCLLLAPFAPFFAEYVHQQLQDKYIIDPGRRLSIHETLLRPAFEDFIKTDIELKVSRMRSIVDSVRDMRNRHIVPAQYQISEVIVIHPHDDLLRDIDSLKEPIMKLVNARNLRVSQDHHEFGAIMRAKLNKDLELTSDYEITFAVSRLSNDSVDQLLRGESICILQQTITLQDIDITYEIKSRQEPNCAIVTCEDVIVAFKMNKPLLFYENGTVKEMAKQIKKLKRMGNFFPSDVADVYLGDENPFLHRVIAKHGPVLEELTACNLILGSSKMETKKEVVHIEKSVDIKGLPMKMYLPSKCDMILGNNFFL